MTRKYFFRGIFACFRKDRKFKKLISRKTVDLTLIALKRNLIKSRKKLECNGIVGVLIPRQCVINLFFAEVTKVQFTQRELKRVSLNMTFIVFVFL